MSVTFDYGVSNYTEKALVETLNDLVQHVENEVVEFKLASNNFDLHKLGQYFSAISNEANLRNKKYGWLIFGVDDTTHEFRGTNYKNNPVSLEKLKLEIAKRQPEQFHLWIFLWCIRFLWKESLFASLCFKFLLR